MHEFAKGQIFDERVYVAIILVTALISSQTSSYHKKYTYININIDFSGIQVSGSDTVRLLVCSLPLFEL